MAVEYLQSGGLSLPPGIKSASESLEKAQRGFASVGKAADGFNSMLDSIGSTLAGAVMSAATGIGTVLAGGFALAVKEAFHFNQEMENTTIGLANMANAAGTTQNFGGALRLAGDVVKQMRQDAKELPGEFKDLQNIMALIEPATANAGMGMFGAEKMAAQTMVAAKMLNVPMAVAGREMSMMLAGNARHSMPLFTKLGFTDAKAFNNMDQAGRTAAIEGKLGKLNTPEALDAVKNTWETIKSTAVDTIRQSVSMVGGPLFSRVKELVKGFTDLGNTNPRLKEHLVDIGQKLGQDIVKAFDYGVGAVQKWYGPVTTFLGTMERGFSRIFNSFSPLMSGLFDRIEAFMNDPAAFTKIESLVGQMIALRAGGAAVSMGASIAPGMLTSISSLGGGGAAGAALASSAAIGLAAALAAVAFAVYGFIDALTDTTNQFHGAAVATGKETVTAFTKLADSAKNLWTEAIEPLANIMGIVLMTAVNGFVEGLTLAIDAVNGLVMAIQWVNNKLYGPSLRPTEHVYTPPAEADLIGFSKLFNAPPEPSDIGAKQPPTHNTTIHKIEIKVDGEADPQRVAKLTVDMLFDKVRNPTSSTGGPPNFSRELGF